MRSLNGGHFKCPPVLLNHYEFSNIFSISCHSFSLISWSSCYCFVSKPSWKSLGFVFGLKKFFVFCAAVFFAQQKTKAVQKCCVFCFAKNKDAYILFCWTFSFGKCSAVQKCIFASHFPKENVQHHIFQRKMFSINKMLQMHLMPKWFDALQKYIFASHFVTQNVTNAFDAKCILAYIFQRKMFSVHFPKENVQLCKNAFDAKMLCFLLCKKQRCVHFVLLNIFLWKMYAKMHFCIKCIWCVHFVLLNIFLWKMFSCAKMHLMQKCCVFCFAKNKDAYILFCWTFSFGKCTQKCIFASNAFLHQQNVTNAFWQRYIFLCKMFSITFSKGKCSASNAFWRTFDFVKCSASHFPKENVQQSNAQHQIHFCKCCAWAAKTSKAKNNLVSQTILFFVNKALR